MPRSRDPRKRSEQIHPQGEDTLREAGHLGTDPESLRRSLEEEKRRREAEHRRATGRGFLE